ncbi:lipocalin family protein [Tenacibaculum amylolyticum]|uniref:lipocalin family protein n=1 Tax=Tenacibaculum amylolyticum TaxID=104269 RepID=UPI0038958921
MRKIILLLVLHLSASTIYAQSKEDLLGKWQLEHFEVNGQEIVIKDAFNTTNVYQVFKDKGAFVSVIGDQKIEGTWELKNKEIIISSRGVKANQKVLAFKDDYVKYSFKEGKDVYITSYKKVKK